MPLRLSAWIRGGLRDDLVKCSVCEESIKKTEAYFGDVGTYYENKLLCESCYSEDEPYATVLYEKDDEPYVISRTGQPSKGSGPYF
jgi:hypothetical protein